MPPSTQRPIASPSRRDGVFPQHFILKELNTFPSPGGYFKKRKAMYCAVWVNAGSAMAAIIAKAHGSMDNYPSLDWSHSQILLTLTDSSQVQWVWRPPRNRCDPERPRGWRSHLEWSKTTKYLPTKNRESLMRAVLVWVWTVPSKHTTQSTVVLNTRHSSTQPLLLILERWGQMNLCEC